MHLILKEIGYISHFDVSFRTRNVRLRYPPNPFLRIVPSECLLAPCPFQILALALCLCLASLTLTLGKQCRSGSTLFAH